MTFQTDATIYRADLDKGQRVEFKTNGSRRTFIDVTEGNLSINNKNIKKDEQARVDREGKLTLKANPNSSFILIDVPSCKGWGYDIKTLKGKNF